MHVKILNQCSSESSNKLHASLEFKSQVHVNQYLLIELHQCVSLESPQASMSC